MLRGRLKNPEVDGKNNSCGLDFKRKINFKSTILLIILYKLFLGI